jgi:hypothetical protein
MSASHFPVLRATALQAATALARYERHVRGLAATWLDMDLYRTVSEEIDEIKLYCTVLPDVSLPWAAVLVSHAELIHALWDSSHSGQRGAGEDVAQNLQVHLACIDALVRRCLRVADPGGEQGPPH